jgi:hypothetical protein
MNRLRKVWWLAALLVASALLALNPGPPQALGQGATPVAVTALTPSWSFIVHGMQDPYLGVLINPRDPVPGTRYVGFDVEVVNDSDQPLTYTGNAVFVRDENGFAYRSGAVTGSEPALQARTLLRSERARGWVWFGVQEGARLSELVLVPAAPELRVALVDIPRIPGTPRPTATPTPGITPSPTVPATPAATPAATPRPTQPVATATATASPAPTQASSPVVITSPAATPRATATSAAQATPTPAATATPAAATGIAPGATVITGIADANLRGSPALDAPILATLPLGTEVTVTGPAITADGLTWWPVLVPETGQEGFVAEDLLVLPAG